MMTSLERFINEMPQPAAIVDLVEVATQFPWPKSQSEKDALFDRLGWGHKLKSPASTSSARGVRDHFHLDTRDDGPPIFAASWELNGLIESIQIQLRLDSALPDPEATTCFNAIVNQLTALHGEPSIPWHGQRGLRKMWKVHDIDVDVTWNDSRSSLMIGIQDERVFQRSGSLCP